MPKKKKVEPSIPPPAPRRCFRCDGTGEICENCGESEGACGCGEDEDEQIFTPYDCPDCKGTGK